MPSKGGARPLVPVALGLVCGPLLLGDLLTGLVLICVTLLL